MEVVGARGVLKVGHYRIAIIRDWSLVLKYEQLNDREPQLVGRIAAVDEFWSTSSPTAIGLFMGECWWVWGEGHGTQLKVPLPLVPNTRTTIGLVGNPVAIPNFD